MDTSVLRQTPFRDVQVGHDLDSRGYRQGDVTRRRHHLIKNAVDSIAHFELVFERLEVDVAGFVLDGLEKHEVQELFHGVGLGHLLQLGQVDAVSPSVELGEILIVAELVNQTGDGFLIPFGVVAIECFLQIGGAAKR